MSWVFGKDVLTNADSTQQKNIDQQWNYLKSMRAHYMNNEKHISSMAMVTNQGLIPKDVWRDMDTQTKAIMRAPNLTLLEDLMPLSKSLPWGKIVQDYRQASDAGNVVTSVSGNVPILMDKTQYNYDGNPIPVHAVGYAREARELDGMRSEGFDALLDDNANAARALMDRMSSYLYTGDDGVVVKGRTATGVKNNANTKLRDLGAGGANIDLTDPNTEGLDIYEEFKAGRDVLQINNNVRGQLTIYVSRTIRSNMERPWDTANSSNVSILQWVRDLEGIAAVKEDASLTGNEYLIVAVDSQYIKPLVAMATGTYAVPRTMFNDPHHFIIANAVGLEIRADYDGRSGVLYAREA